MCSDSIPLECSINHFSPDKWNTEVKCPSYIPLNSTQFLVWWRHQGENRKVVLRGVFNCQCLQIQPYIPDHWNTQPHRFAVVFSPPTGRYLTAFLQEICQSFHSNAVLNVHLTGCVILQLVMRWGQRKSGKKRKKSYFAFGQSPCS